ncbi:hypothetical protein PR002_g5915 [Phytophthora rubi]|uniref:Uncharacterized protein n=1 Tax=Phytophthora rubi TaxID=129364 RepID=A0A6A3N5G8_9STRA|nr:hypothetical protein PR002_g5915 [Phytophthora rubi]
MASPSPSPRSHRETLVVSAEELLHPLEARVFQLSQELTQTDPQVPALSDDEVITKLNMIAETLEEVETNFRKERSSPYRRDGHLIGNLLQVLEQNEDFYPMLEGKLSDLSMNRVKAATCRLLLATVPVNSRAIVRMLDDDEEMLERVCGFATDADPGLRCYATGLLSVGLRDRSVADTVVNNDTPVKLLKRARMYATKLEKERQQAVKFIQDHLRLASSRHKKTAGGGGNTSTKASTPQRSLKRKHSDIANRTPAHGNDHGEITDATASMETEEEEEEPAAAVTMQQSLPISGGDEDVLGAFEDGSIVMPSPEHHEEDFKRLVMLELLYTLDCLGSMGEYLEIFAPALKEDIIGTVITFLHSKNPAVISHTMTLTSHFLAHKKFSFSLVEAGGVDLLFTVFKSQQAAGQVGLLDRSLSMCLHGFASSSAVIERLVVMNPDNMLSVTFTLLSSPNDRARQNAVVFFSLTLGFKVILDYFEKHNGLYTILNIIRVGNHPKSAAQRQLAQDACLCLRQYVRMHMALVTHRLRRKLAQLNHPSNRQSNIAPVLTTATVASRIPARVPKINWSKAIDLDDKTHEQNMVFYEKYRFSASSGNSNNSWSAATGPGGGMWPPAAKLSHLRGILVLLEVVAMMCSVMQNTDPDANSSTTRIWTGERAQFCLDSLRVLTLVVPTLASEVCSTEVSLDEGSTSKQLGMAILLEIAMSSNPRDSELVRDALRVFCNCVSPPHHEDCWQHPYKDIRQYTLTARSMRTKKDDQAQRSNSETAEQGPNAATPDTCSNCCSKAKDDKMLRPVRKLARERNAIKVCVYLLRYKSSVQNADSIRLLATRALLGLSRDRHISQILEKMQVGQLLSDMIRSDPVLEENADIHVRFRESALDLISHVTHRASNVVINEATDPTVRKIEKASIVANTKITYDENELLRLIHDHLVTKGLHHAASALVDEAKIDVEKRRKVSLAGDAQPFRTEASLVNGGTLSSSQMGSTPHKKQTVTDQEVPSSVASRREKLAVNEIGLWEANDMSALVERWRFKGGLRPQFNHYGDRIVALDARPIDEEDELDGPGITVKGAVVLDIATGDVLCDLKDAMRSNDYGAETNCCFSPCDGTILTDGMLWDARIPTRALYKFDKLSNVGCGFFHPNGNEVIVNSAVWDLRTYRLLRMVPALDKCTIKFNPSGSVLFAYYPYAGGDYLERRKSKLKSWFRVLDSRDYKDITTIDLGRPVFDISLNTNGTLLSVVEGRYLDAGDVDDDDSICRLYDVGRKRPAEDDSDAEDGGDDSDTLDDDEYDDENSSDEDENMDEEEDDTDEDEEEMFDSDSQEAEGTEDEEGSDDGDDDEDAAAHILAIEDDSGDEDGNGSILSDHDLGYLLELPDTTYYEVHGQYSSDEDDAEEDE